MSTPRLGIGIAAITFLLGIFTVPQGSAQRPLIFHLPLTLKPVLHQARTIHRRGLKASRATKSERAFKTHRLALERYHFLKRLAPQFHGIPLWTQDGDSSASEITIFPLGRSDRVYIILWDYDNVGTTIESSRIFCYQHKGGRDQLVYKIDIRSDYRPAKNVKYVQNLLDYVSSREQKVHGIGFEFLRKINTFAQKDLATKRDYVVYQLSSWMYGLSVYLISATNEDESEDYDLDKDPVTKAALKDDEFFKKYGLPVAKKELRALQ